MTGAANTAKPSTPPQKMKAKHGGETYTRETLVRMLVDSTYEPEPLVLKAGDVTVGRKYTSFDPRDQGSQDKKALHVCKSYKGAMHGRYLDEHRRYTELVSLGLDCAVNKTGDFPASEGKSIGIFTQWGGFDLSDWNTLFGESNSPFCSSVPAFLKLFRSMLVTLKPFHDAGFVHNDLLARNWVMKAEYDASTQRLTFLKPGDSPKLIDLEFCLGPLEAVGSVPADQREPWFWDAEKKVRMFLGRTGHSQLLGFEDPCNPSDPLNGKSFAPSDFKHVDWGVDLYTLGYGLKQWVELLKTHTPAQEQTKWQDALDYLSLDLYEELVAYNNSVPLGTSRKGLMPHQNIIAQIDSLLKAQNYKGTDPVEAVLDKKLVATAVRQMDEQTAIANPFAAGAGDRTIEMPAAQRDTGVTVILPLSASPAARLWKPTIGKIIFTLAILGLLAALLFTPWASRESVLKDGLHLSGHHLHRDIQANSQKAQVQTGERVPFNFVPNSPGYYSLLSHEPSDTNAQFQVLRRNVKIGTRDENTACTIGSACEFARNLTLVGTPGSFHYRLVWSAEARDWEGLAKQFPSDDAPASAQSGPVLTVAMPKRSLWNRMLSNTPFDGYARHFGYDFADWLACPQAESRTAPLGCRDRSKMHPFGVSQLIEVKLN